MQRNLKTAWLGNIDMDVARHLRTMVLSEIKRLEDSGIEGTGDTESDQLIDRLYITHSKLSEAIRKGGI